MRLESGRPSLVVDLKQRLESGRPSLVVDLERGGRIAALRVDDREVPLTSGTGSSTTLRRATRPRTTRQRTTRQRTTRRTANARNASFAPRLSLRAAPR
jgi:hypothetical protein